MGHPWVLAGQCTATRGLAQRRRWVPDAFSLNAPTCFLVTPCVPTGGYHRVRVGEQFRDGRYTVLHKLGWGHFSTVWMVRNEEVRLGQTLSACMAGRAVGHAGMEPSSVAFHLKAPHSYHPPCPNLPAVPSTLLCRRVP